MDNNVTYCDYGNHEVSSKGYFRSGAGWVACQDCCAEMTEAKYKAIIEEHCGA